MKRVFVRSSRIGDENLYYGVKPATKGIRIDSSSTQEVLSVSDNGWGHRKLAKSGISGTRLVDPNYYSLDTWLPAPVVDFNGDNVVKLGEELICTITNLESHLSTANPNNDMVYTWVPDGVQSNAIEGVQVRLNPRKDVTWTVCGISPTLGKTEITTFTLSVEDDENPIPLVQTLTLRPGSAARFKILNAELFVGTNVVYEIYEDDVTSPLSTSTTDVINHQAPDEAGIRWLNIRAVIDGTATESRRVQEIATLQDETVVNYQANFEAVDRNTRLPLADQSSLGEFGTKGYFEVKLYSEEREIELINVTGAKAINPGIIFDKGLVELEFNTRESSYPITFEYLIRKKGTVGGIRYAYTFTTINNVNQIPYNFQLTLPETLSANTSGELFVSDTGVHEQGYYRYSLNSEALSALQIAGTESTIFEMNAPIDYVAGGTSATFPLVVTIYDIIDQVVQTLSKNVTIVEGDVDEFASNGRNDFFTNRVITGISGPIKSFMKWTIPTIYPIVGRALDLTDMTVFDVFDVNNPSRLTNRLGQYGFPGSADYPHEFYRDTDVANYLTSDNPTDAQLENYRKVNLSLDVSGTRLNGCDSRIVSGGNISFTDHQPVRFTSASPRDGEGLHIATIHNAAGDVNVIMEYGDQHLSLKPTLEAVGANKLNTSQNVYLVGPSNVIMLIIPEITAIPELGRLVVEWTDQSHTTPQFLIVDADEDTTLQGTTGFLEFDGDFSFRIISHGGGIDLRVQADDIQGLTI